MSAMQDMTMLLMQALQNQGKGMEPGRDPFSLGQATAGADMETKGAARSAASRFAEQAGVDESELTGPVEGPMAAALGIEGVEPDFDRAEMMFKLLGTAKQLGAEEAMAGSGGPAAPAARGPQQNSALRDALAFQQLQHSAQQFGQGHLGGQMIATMGPALAPLMMGPYLEQQQAAAAQQVRLKNQLEIEKTKRAGEKHRVDMEAKMAQTELAKARTREVGKGKNKITLRTIPNVGVMRFDADGNSLGMAATFPKKDEEPFTLDIGDAIEVYSSKRAFEQGVEPSRVREKAKPGSASERKDIAELETQITNGLKFLDENYEEAFTGPTVGRALNEAKTGGQIGQYLSAAKLKVLFKDEQEQQRAIDYNAKLQQVKADLIFLYSKSQVPASEMEQRRAQLALETDFGPQFKASLKAVTSYAQTKLARLKENANMKPKRSPFVGKPSTSEPGLLQQQELDSFLNEVMP